MNNENNNHYVDDKLCPHNIISYRMYINFYEGIEKDKLTKFVRYMINKLSKTKINSTSDETLLNCKMGYQFKPSNWNEHLLLYNNVTSSVYGKTCIHSHYKCEKNCQIDKYYVNHFCNGYTPFWKDCCESFPVQHAISCASFNIVKFMITKGAQLNLMEYDYIFQYIRHEHKLTQSYTKPYITKNDKIYKTIKLLFECTKLSNTKFNYNINEYDSTGHTLLHYAIKSTNFDLIELLVHHKADVNLKFTSIITKKINEHFYQSHECISTVIDLFVPDFENNPGICAVKSNPGMNTINSNMNSGLKNNSSAMHYFDEIKVKQFCIPTMNMLFNAGLNLEYDDNSHIQTLPTLANFLKQKQLLRLKPLLSQFILPNILNNIIFDYAW